MSTEQARRAKSLTAKSTKPPALSTTLNARILRHDQVHGLSTLYFGDGELRVPLVAAPVDSGVRVTIYARDVSIALSRPMDVSITNRLPGTIVAIEPLALPYVPRHVRFRRDPARRAGHHRVGRAARARARAARLGHDQDRRARERRD
jgi:ABC-type molybdate transport system ATPase subunit